MMHGGLETGQCADGGSHVRGVRGKPSCRVKAGRERKSVSNQILPGRQTKAKQPTECRGQTDRSARVSANRERCNAGRHDRRGAAAGSSRGESRKLRMFAVA